MYCQVTQTCTGMEHRLVRAHIMAMMLKAPPPYGPPTPSLTISTWKTTCGGTTSGRLTCRWTAPGPRRAGFEFKAYHTVDTWEGDVAQVVECGGTAGGAKPYSTYSHMARCGYTNMFRWGQDECTINKNL